MTTSIVEANLAIIRRILEHKLAHLEPARIEETISTMRIYHGGTSSAQQRKDLRDTLEAAQDPRFSDVPQLGALLDAGYEALGEVPPYAGDL